MAVTQNQVLNEGDSASPTTTPNKPRRGRGVTGTRFTFVLGVATIVSMVVLVLFGLFLSPPDVTQGESVRILYIHVGTVWVAYVAFGVTALASALFLFKRTTSLTWDRIAGASAEVGVLFMALTLFAGSIWGRLSWGKFWVWDARVTTTAFLFITYIGYSRFVGSAGAINSAAGARPLSHCSRCSRSRSFTSVSSCGAACTKKPAWPAPPRSSSRT